PKQRMVHISLLFLLSLLFFVATGEDSVSSSADLNNLRGSFEVDNGNGMIIVGLREKNWDESSIDRGMKGRMKKREDGPSIRRDADYSWKKRSMRIMREGEERKRANEPTVRRTEQYIWKKRSEEWKGRFRDILSLIDAQ
ncbi:hypothetical protein PMAYCL1PPCAC_29209, partial [Pristionchus mayeri]